MADAYDVMTAARAYQRPVSRAAACASWSSSPAASSTRPWSARWWRSARPGCAAPRALLAWLGDLPLVASSAVPGRDRGAGGRGGALATGAVASGPAALGLPTDLPPERRGALRRREPGRRLGGRPGQGRRQPAAGVGRADRSATRLRTGRDGGHATRPPSPADTARLAADTGTARSASPTTRGPAPAQQRLAGTHRGTDAEAGSDVEAVADLADRHPHRHGRRRGHRPGRHGRRGAPGPGRHGHRHGRQRAPEQSAP